MVYDHYILSLEGWVNTLNMSDKSIFLEHEEIIKVGSDTGEKTKNLKQTTTSIIDIEKLKYFTRKTIKKMIMTAAYGSSYRTRLDSFKEGIQIHFTNPLIDKELIKLFTSFNTYIEKTSTEGVYLENKMEVIKEFIISQIEENSSVILETPLSKVNLIYFKKKIKTIDRKSKWIDDNGDLVELRGTKKVSIYDKNSVDLKRTVIGGKPNIVHFSDATFNLQINNNPKVKTAFLFVHDCAYVDPFNVSLFIEIANEEFKNTMGIALFKDGNIINKTNSLFIFI